MSDEQNGSGRVSGAPGRLVVVRVEDAIEPKLAARTGLRLIYQSPPQTREPAMTLARLLLFRAPSGSRRGITWRCPIAGGQRTVTLQETSGNAASATGNAPWGSR